MSLKWSKVLVSDAGRECVVRRTRKVVSDARRSRALALPRQQSNVAFIKGHESLVSQRYLHWNCEGMGKVVKFLNW
jgi:hypothetical protein